MPFGSTQDSHRPQTIWLSIFCYVVEHPEGLILIDTGIPADANKPVWFPPWMRMVELCLANADRLASNT